MSNYCFIWNTEMTRNLGLKGNEMLVYSIICSFSQGEQGCFYGSLSTLTEMLGVEAKNTAVRSLKSLTEKGLISKRDIYVEGVKRCAYTTISKIDMGIAKNDMGYSKNCYGGIAKNDINNKEYIKDNNITPINGSKSARAKKTFEERASEFKASLVKYVDKYGQSMIDDFFGYWTEPNQSRTKMRWEMQDTWDTAHRLGTWNKREQSKEKSAAQLKEEKRKKEERRYIEDLDAGTQEYLKLIGRA